MQFRCRRYSSAVVCFFSFPKTVVGFSYEFDVIDEVGYVLGSVGSVHNDPSGYTLLATKSLHSHCIACLRA